MRRLINADVHMIV